MIGEAGGYEDKGRVPDIFVIRTDDLSSALERGPGFVTTRIVKNLLQGGKKGNREDKDPRPKFWI